MYLCAGLLHDHVGRLVLKELVGLEDLPGLRLVPRQHQGQLAQDADPGRRVRPSVFKTFKKRAIKIKEIIGMPFFWVLQIQIDTAIPTHFLSLF